MRLLETRFRYGRHCWRDLGILALLLKAKFYYAILVADRSKAGRRPAASWNLAYHLAC